MNQCQPQSDGDRRKARGCGFRRRAEDDDQEGRGQDDFSDQTRQQAVMSGDKAS